MLPSLLCLACHFIPPTPLDALENKDARSCKNHSGMNQNARIAEHSVNLLSSFRRRAEIQFTSDTDGLISMHPCVPPPAFDDRDALPQLAGSQVDAAR